MDLKHLMHNRMNINDNAHSAMKEMLEAHNIITKKVKGCKSSKLHIF